MTSGVALALALATCAGFFDCVPPSRLTLLIVVRHTSGCS